MQRASLVLNSTQWSTLMSEVLLVFKLIEGPISKKKLPAVKRLQSRIGRFESRIYVSNRKSIQLL